MPIPGLDSYLFLLVVHEFSGFLFFGHTLFSNIWAMRVRSVGDHATGVMARGMLRLMAMSITAPTSIITPLAGVMLVNKYFGGFQNAPWALHAYVAFWIMAALQLVPDVEGTSNARRSSKRDELRELYQVGIGNDGRTAWDAYNAITEWANYRAPVRGARLDDAARNLVRVESTLWGQGASLATDAQNLLQRVYVLS